MIGLGIAASLGLAFAAYKIAGKPDNKLSLVDQIMYKYGSPDSPYYSANFDSAKESLMRYDSETLKRVLAGTLS